MTYREMVEQVVDKDRYNTTMISYDCMSIEDFWARMMPKSQDGSLPEMSNELRALVAAFAVSNYFDEMKGGLR